MDKIIFSKFSYNNRDPKFQCKTTIKECENKTRYVVKSALHMEGSKHIANMLAHYDSLSKNYKESKVHIAKCEKIDDQTILFEFINGNSFEDELDAILLNGDYQRLVEEIRKYYQALFLSVNTQENFQYSYEYREVFGDNNFDESTTCLTYANIDAIFGNVKIKNSMYYLIDYEWCFPFSIPVKYIIYRSIARYVNKGIQESKSRMKLLEDVNLFKLFNINDKELKKFEDMERNFQKYVVGSYIPEGIIYNTLSTDTFYMDSLRELKDSLTCKVQVYEDRGDGFKEENSYFLSFTEKNNRFYFFHELTLSAELKSLRLDPSTTPCLFILNRFTYTNKVLEPIKFDHNAYQLSDNLYLFMDDDSKIIISNIEYNKIAIEGYYIPLNDFGLKYFSEYIHVQEKEKLDLNTSLNNYRTNVDGLLGHIKNLENKIKNDKVEIQIKESMISEESKSKERIINKFNRITHSKLFKLIKWYFKEDELEL